ncbi:MAG: hypothetical protein FWC43_04555 [Planctomycetaceae bacterium]|nr:hypothetical protein [Planctomycetaceae bacterium]
MKKNEKEQNEQNEFGPVILGPIYQEIVSGGSEKLKEFIKGNLDFAVHDVEFPFDATKYNNVEALKAFIDAGVHPDTIKPGFTWRTLLEDAISNRAYDAVSFLLDAGANIDNTFDETYASPLTCAVKGATSRTKHSTEPFEKHSPCNFWALYF